MYCLGKRRRKGHKINGYINKFIGWINTFNNFSRMTRILQDRQAMYTGTADKLPATRSNNDIIRNRQERGTCQSP